MELQLGGGRRVKLPVAVHTTRFLRCNCIRRRRAIVERLFHQRLRTNPLLAIFQPRLQLLLLICMM